jgi:hypothetical protein
MWRRRHGPDKLLAPRLSRMRGVDDPSLAMHVLDVMKPGAHAAVSETRLSDKGLLIADTTAQGKPSVRAHVTLARVHTGTHRRRNTGGRVSVLRQGEPREAPAATRAIVRERALRAASAYLRALLLMVCLAFPIA